MKRTGPIIGKALLALAGLGLVGCPVGEDPKVLSRERAKAVLEATERFQGRCSSFTSDGDAAEGFVSLGFLTMVKSDGRTAPLGEPVYTVTEEGAAYFKRVDVLDAGHVIFVFAPAVVIRRVIEQITGIADVPGAGEGFKAVTYTWHYEGLPPKLEPFCAKFASSLSHKEEAVFRRFDDGWRVKGN